MVGIELSVDATEVVQLCMDRGLLLNCTQGNVIRLLPAMTLTDKELASGCDILVEVLREFTS